MRSSLFFLFSFFGLLHVFLYLHLRRGFGSGLWARIFWTASVCMMALPFLMHPRIEGLRSLLPSPRVAELLFVSAFTWIAVVGLSCMAFLFMDIIEALLRLFGVLTSRAWPVGVTPRRSAAFALVLSALLVLYSASEAWNVRRVDLQLPTDKLPKGVERLRIVQITDVHLGGAFGYKRLERVMKIVRDAKPDLFVATGDIVDGDTTGREAEAALFASHGATLGAFAVTGNHEFYVGIEQSLDFLERAGFEMLRNRKVKVGGVVVAGVDDTGFNRRSEETNLLKKAATDAFVLFLRHRPYVMPSSQGKFDLQLSGHVHGGQIWPFNYVVMQVTPHVPGLSFKGASAVYVSNGTGFWGPPLRFLAPPEVTVIDLVRPKS